MVFQRVAQPVLQPAIQKMIGGRYAAGGGGAWTPADLVNATALQWFDTPTYQAWPSKYIVNAAPFPQYPICDHAPTPRFNTTLANGCHATYSHIPEITPAGTWSVSAWMRLSNIATAQSILLNCNGPADRNQCFVINGAAFVSTQGSGGVVNNPGGPLTANTFQHILFTMNNTAGRVYVNGVLGGQSASGAAMPQFASTIGQNPNLGDSGVIRNGNLFNVSVYDSELTAQDAADLATYTPIAPQPIRQWIMQENGGSTFYNVIANANHATIAGTIGDLFTNANAKSSDIRDWTVFFGGRYSAPTIIPALSNMTTAADGGAITIRNQISPGSLIDIDPTGQLAIDYPGLPTDNPYTVADNVSSKAPVNSKFVRTNASIDNFGRDRWATTDQTLTGDDLTNMQNWKA